MNPAQEDLLPVNRNYILIGGCATLIFTTIVAGLLISSFNKKDDQQQNNISISQGNTSPTADLSKYNQDSDLDNIPNFIEDETLLNTYIAETDYCQKKFPSCANSPIEKSAYVSILINASTSMNIPATDSRKKFELVKDELYSNFRDLAKKKYILSEIRTFGNKGTLSGIPNSESCVSNLVLKGYSSTLNEQYYEKDIKNMFEKYVPNGKSPLVFTLEQAEKNFPDPKGNNLVQIVTDSLDDCNGDLKTAIKAILDRGIIKRVDLISLYSNQDISNILKDAIESNGGTYSASSNISTTLNQNYENFIYNEWCKVKNYNTIYSCVDENYSKAINALQSKLTVNTPKNELEKIKEIQSSINVVIENFRKDNNSVLRKELNNYLNPKEN